MLSVIPSMEPEQFLLNPSGRPVLETSGGKTERGGRPLLPHTDVSATRLHGGLDTTLQVTSKCCGPGSDRLSKHVKSKSGKLPICEHLTDKCAPLMRKSRILHFASHF